MSLARANARRHGVGDRVHVVRGDLLEPLPRGLDLIVANLPYLPAADRSLYRDLAAEPEEAVFAADDGLGPYRRLFSSAGERLRNGGVVMIQLHRRVLSFERAELAASGAALGELVRERRPAERGRTRLRRPARLPALA